MKKCSCGRPVRRDGLCLVCWTYAMFDAHQKEVKEKKEIKEKHQND